MSKPINVKESSSDFFRRYLDILDEAVRGTIQDPEYGSEPRLPINQHERNAVASALKTNRIANRASLAQHKDALAKTTKQSSPDYVSDLEKSIDAKEKYTRGAASADRPTNAFDKDYADKLSDLYNRKRSKINYMGQIGKTAGAKHFYGTQNEPGFNPTRGKGIK